MPHIPQRPTSSSKVRHDGFPEPFNLKKRHECLGQYMFEVSGGFARSSTQVKHLFKMEPTQQRDEAVHHKDATFVDAFLQKRGSLRLLIREDCSKAPEKLSMPIQTFVKVDFQEDGKYKLQVSQDLHTL